MALFLRKNDDVIFLRLNSGIHGSVLRTTSSGSKERVDTAVVAYKVAAQNIDSAKVKAEKRLLTANETKTVAEAHLFCEAEVRHAADPTRVFFHVLQLSSCVPCCRRYDHANDVVLIRRRAGVFFLVIGRRRGT